VCSDKRSHCVRRNKPRDATTLSLLLATVFNRFGCSTFNLSFEG
jgi:hypothetical protein